MNLDQRIHIAQVRTAAATMAAPDLYALMLSGSPLQRSNAAWVLTHKPDDEIANLPQHEMIDLILSTESTTLRRLVLNLVERQPLDAENMRSDFLDYCLSHMATLEEPPGVQTLCMKLAHRMCSHYPELANEFGETLRLIPAEHYKPDTKCLIKKLKK